MSGAVVVGVLILAAIGGAIALARPAPIPNVQAPLPFYNGGGPLSTPVCQLGTVRTVKADAWSPPVTGTVQNCISPYEACVRDDTGRVECGDL